MVPRRAIVPPRLRRPDIREHRRDILKIAKDERVEVDAKKRFVHIENDCFEHAGTFLEKSI